MGWVVTVGYRVGCCGCHYDHGNPRVCCGLVGCGDGLVDQDCDDHVGRFEFV